MSALEMAIVNVRDRLVRNGRNPANNNAGIRTGSDLHYCEMFLKEIERLRAELATWRNIAESHEPASRLRQAEFVRMDSELGRLRAELATKDARIAELEGLLAYGTDTSEYRRIRARAERAEAECKALREALEPFAEAADGRDHWPDAYISALHVTMRALRKARAALNPSPAECDIEAGSVALKAAENEEARNHIEANRPPPPPGWRQW